MVYVKSSITGRTLTGFQPRCSVLVIKSNYSPEQEIRHHYPGAGYVGRGTAPTIIFPVKYEDEEFS
jgi:hypothetical protein